VKKNKLSIIFIYFVYFYLLEFRLLSLLNTFIRLQVGLLKDMVYNKKGLLK